VLDLRELSEIDATGLGTLIFAQAMLRNAGGGLALANLHPAHMGLLVLAKIDAAFEVFEDDQDAINSFFPDRRIRHYDLSQLLKSRERHEEAKP
jgi:anti-sigma B factor antagonist